MRTVKAALKKILGSQRVTRVEMETVLTEIEAVINRRPLTHITDFPDFKGALTPAHFLFACSTEKAREDAETDLSKPHQELIELLQGQRSTLQSFWKVWSTLYLTNLPPVVRNKQKWGNIEVGDMVLLRDDDIGKRSSWPLAIITKLFHGRDGKVRTVELRMNQGGPKVRPIQRLYKLEVAPDGIDWINKEA